MKQITLNIPNNQFSFFMKLINSLKFVQVADNDEKEVSYNPEFVAKIEESRRQHKAGQYTTVNINELDSFLGLK